MPRTPTAASADTKPTRTAHGAAQRQALVEAAFQLIAEGGFENLRTRDVAGRAGVNIATLHYYFATKEDLIQAVVLLLIEQFATIHDPAAASRPYPQPPRDQLRQELLEIPYQTEHHPAVQVVLLELLLRSLRDPAIREMMQGLDAHWQAYIASHLQAGVEAGVFRADLAVSTAAVAFRSLIAGYIMRFMLDPNTAPPDQIYEVIERGLLPPAIPR